MTYSFVVLFALGIIAGLFVSFSTFFPEVGLRGAYDFFKLSFRQLCRFSLGWNSTWFTLGFIAWAIGYVIFALTKIFLRWHRPSEKECLMTTILAAAPTMDLSGIQTAMTSAFKQVQAGASDMITAAVPFALVIIGTVLAVTIGIKVFKKLTAQA